MKNRILDIITSLILIFITIVMFINSKIISEEFYKNNIFIFKLIIPSLFPFMIFINFILLGNTIDHLAIILKPIGKIFKLSSYGIVCVIAAIIGGFPYSSILVSQLLKNNKIDVSEAKRIAITMFFPSISFTISLIKIDNNIKYCIYSLYLASFLVLLILGITKKEKNSNSFNKININLDNSFDNLYFLVMKKSIESIISIYFCITFFNIISSIINIYINNNYFNNLISGLLEFSSSSIKVALIENKTIIDYLLINTILSFSSLSIIFQSYYYLKEINITIKKLLIYRLTISLLSLVIFIIFYIIYLHN